MPTPTPTPAEATTLPKPKPRRGAQADVTRIEGRPRLGSQDHSGLPSCASTSRRPSGGVVVVVVVVPGVAAADREGMIRGRPRPPAPAKQVSDGADRSVARSAFRTVGRRARPPSIPIVRSCPPESGTARATAPDGLRRSVSGVRRAVCLSPEGGGALFPRGGPLARRSRVPRPAA
ncbi:hypothetical protein CXG81DRAFT_21044 [Caulochytrium protostelioides]|uniref:Uncharacterized protein n=1 Tax=Caulochytrium protostelioides TaxID=1555241 RepID=A0A4P9WZ55_9FUNG|nr:hypothetical protein CXG81DRAFT_21044 [Caulochytrium protostelioides]|eukprot:RKO98801.1 hypothetical protein CXG81DRAFT_21044 [Caulochytrium protostelioides]